MKTARTGQRARGFAARSSTGLRAVLAALAFSSAAAPAGAQTFDSAADLVTNLFKTRQISADEDLTGDAKIVADSFARSATELKRLITTSIAQLPTLSSGGFTYVTDATTGENTLRTYSLGPLFADRPITGGRGVWNVAFGFQHFSLDTLQSRSLVNDGVPVLDNRSTFGDGFQEFVIVQSFFTVSGSASTFQATYGVHDNIDVGISVPIISVNISGHRQETFDVSRDYFGCCGQTAVDRTHRLYPGPSGVLTTIDSSRSASGLGDVAIRAKVALNKKQDAAVAVDLRLPTGNEDDFLGQGNVSSRLSFVAGHQIGELAGVSGSVGFTKSNLTDEFNYQASVNVAAVRSRVTLGLDILGRTLLDAARLSQVRTLTIESPDGRRSFFDRTLWTDSKLNLLQIAAGGKFHLSGLWVLTASVIFQTDNNGLKGAPIPLVAIDRTWSR